MKFKWSEDIYPSNWRVPHSCDPTKPPFHSPSYLVCCQGWFLCHHAWYLVTSCSTLGAFETDKLLPLSPVPCDICALPCGNFEQGMWEVIAMWVHWYQGHWLELGSAEGTVLKPVHEIRHQKTQNWPSAPHVRRTPHDLDPDEGQFIQQKASFMWLCLLPQQSVLWDVWYSLTSHLFYETCLVSWLQYLRWIWHRNISLERGWKR